MLFLLLAFSISAAPWRFSNPRPHGNNVLDMLFLNDVTWQIGERGSIYTSTDFDLWTPHESGTRNSLRSITTFRNAVFISGQEGLILSGIDPSRMTLRNLGTEDWLEGIAASTNSIVAVGDNGAIFSSTNGELWTRRSDYTTWLRSVAYGADQFVAVGEDGFIATSPDGASWQQRTSGTTAHLNRVSWLNDRFWIVGEMGTVLTNNSPTTFAPVELAVTNTLFTVTANTNEVVLAGDGIVLMGNADGSRWNIQSDQDSPLLAPEWPYYSALWDGRLFLLTGQTGMLVEGFRTNALAPLYWYSTVQPTRSWLWGVTRTDFLYTAVGADATVVTSQDGVEWFREATPTNIAGQVLLGVGGNTNLLVAVGSGGTLIRSVSGATNVVSTNSLGDLITNIVSTFGVHWNKISLPITNDLQGVAATRDLVIVTGGNGTIMTSGIESLGTLWMPRLSGVTTFLSGATTWPGGFVVVGAGGVILTSPDAVSWTRQDSRVEQWIYSVRYVGGRLVAVGEDGLILTSTDAQAWHRQQSGTTEWLNDTTFAQDTWYVMGGNGTLVTSTNASNWTAERSITAKSLYGAATSDNQVIAVGLEGVILRKTLSVDTTPVHIEAYDHAGLSSIFLFTGKIDQRFVLEATSSLTGTWRPVAELELNDPGGTALFELPNDELQMRFFRTRLL